MVVGVCRIDLMVHESQSLKAKRQALRKVIDGIKNRFNVSVAEVADQDLWQRATIGISAVGTDRAFVNSVIDKVLNFIEDQHVVELMDHEMELENY